jgi:putative restriction endonuclease
MALMCLVPTDDWDASFFKVLASNDTGDARGHQGGIVVPKDLRGFFPGLSEAGTSALQPTADRRLTAELFLENRYLGTVSTRYQYQTWGGTRTAESRLTDQLVPLRSQASVNDVLIMQRNTSRLDLFRLTLVRKSSPDYPVVTAATAGRRWGVIGAVPPLSQRELDKAFGDEEATEGQPFSMFESEPAVVESKVRKIARSVAFRETVSRLYEYTCVACGSALRSPMGIVELDAAHIVPRSKSGTDDARNGIALCKRHHWAFDGGLFGISNDMKVIVPKCVGKMVENSPLQDLSGCPIRRPSEKLLSPHPDAIEWHRVNVLLH